MDKKDRMKIAEKALPVLQGALKKCGLCPRNCGVDRTAGETGFCGEGAGMSVYTCDLHHGEEPPLSGSEGSGTIFFSHCNMSCVYCQNHQFSQSQEGKNVSARELSEMMLKLQKKGAHNINLVTPTHILPGIIEALGYAWEGGLEIPIVYNTGGYDSLEAIKEIEGLIDVYLPDMRYSDDSMATRFSSAPGYVLNNRALVREMRRQVGDLYLRDGIALKGLIVRLLVLPEAVSGTEETLKFIRKELGADTCLSVMSQYYPAHKAGENDTINRRLSKCEFASVTLKIAELGLNRGWVQPFEGEFEDRFAGENFQPNI